MFSSKITPNFYILIFKEHIRHIYNARKIKHENSQFKLNLKNRLWFTSCYKLKNYWQGSLILQYNKFLDIGNSDNKGKKKPLPAKSEL